MTKTFMDRAVAGEWATQDALLDALAWPMTFPGDAPKAEAAGMTQEESDLLHAAACTGIDSYRSRAGRMLAYIVDRRRENDALRELVKEAEESNEGNCSWCGAWYAGKPHLAHHADCKAAKVMGWGVK